MLEELSKIDVSPIDALKALKDEHDVLDGRIKAMDDMKAQVAETVYARVRSDYAARVAALVAQAKPLKEQAREQFAQLKALLAKLDADREAVKLDKQEIELRHQLGEYDKKEFDKRIKAIETQVVEQGQWYEKGQEIKTRFLAAVHAESELESAPPPAATAKPSYSTAEVPALEARAVGAPPGSGAAPPNATVVMPAIDVPTPPSSSTMVMPSPRAPASATAKPAASDATQMFRPARFVPQNPEAGKNTYSIALKTLSIGSDSGNDIRLGGAGVEPRHAQINPTPQGYMVVDLGTPSGTRVNAEKIKERVLQNEDVVQIGLARFVFRT